MLAPSVLDFQNSGPHLQEFSSKKILSAVLAGDAWEGKCSLALEQEFAEVTGGICGCSLVSFDCHGLCGRRVPWSWRVTAVTTVVLLEIKEPSVHSHNCSGPCCESADFVEVMISVEVVFCCTSGDLGIGDFGSSS